jgi:hypothetical protein
MDREFEPVFDDEREIDLDDEDEPDAPPTLDPAERVEAPAPEPPLPDDERPV